MQDDASKAEEPSQENRTEALTSDVMKQKVYEAYVNLARRWHKIADDPG